MYSQTKGKQLKKYSGVIDLVTPDLNSSKQYTPYLSKKVKITKDEIFRNVRLEERVELGNNKGLGRLSGWKKTIFKSDNKR